MFVGEIGIPRHEFLYDIEFWEARRILRGYERRNMLSNQLLRLTAYFSCFAFRENKSAKTPQQWLPLYFDTPDDAQADDIDSPQTVTQEDIDDMNRDIDLFKKLMNTKSKKKRTAK